MPYEDRRRSVQAQVRLYESHSVAEHLPLQVAASGGYNNKLQDSRTRHQAQHREYAPEGRERLRKHCADETPRDPSFKAGKLSA